MLYIIINNNDSEKSIFSIDIHNNMSSVFKNIKTSGTTQLQGTNIFGTGATTYTMPTARGTNLQILSTDGAGNVSWSIPSASQLYTSGTAVEVNSTAPPGSGYALVTTTSTVATWQTITSIANSTYNYVLITATTNPTAYSALTTDDMISTNSSLGAINITLPLISSLTAGKKKYVVVDEAGVANGTNKKINILPSGTNTINLTTSASISSGKGSLTIFSNTTTNWVVY